MDKGVRNAIQLIIALLIALILVIFAVQNSVQIPVKLWFWEYKASLSLLIIISVILGVIVSFLFMIPGMFNRTRQLSQLKKKNKEQSGKIQDLNKRIEELQRKESKANEQTGQGSEEK